MKKVNRRKNVALFVCLLLSILTVAGIPAIPLGFVFDMIWLAIIGIVFVAHGFYGITFYWLWFAGLVKCSKVVRCVEHDYMYNVNEISQHTQLPVESVQKQINRAINKGFLVGVKFDGINITSNDNQPLKRNGVRVQCAYCGTFFYRTVDNHDCPNCGSSESQECE